jgi:hypothetical protein
MTSKRLDHYEEVLDLFDHYLEIHRVKCHGARGINIALRPHGHNINTCTKEVIRDIFPSIRLILNLLRSIILNSIVQSEPLDALIDQVKSIYILHLEEIVNKRAIRIASY